MEPGEEAQALCAFWRAVNGGDNEQEDLALTGYNLARDEIAEAIKGLQANKSAPQHCAPHVLWKLAAEPIADYMEEQVFGRWRQGRAAVPGDWAAAWLVFLSKPGKSSTDPSCLRPISLLDPMGKAVCGVLKTHLLPYLMEKAKFLPLFGYIQQRSPQQALEMVFAHCAEARDLAKAQTRSLYELRSGRVRSQCAGGLQISIDFSQAFDRADRCLLFQALEFLEVPADLQGLVKRWVQATTFHIHKAETWCSYSSDKGIRQGCKLSPTLWCCLFVYILRRIDQALDQQCSQQHLIGFADDLHLRWLFRDRSGIDMALQEADKVFSLLEDMGFLLSRDKTVCLLRAEGVQVPHMLRKLVHKKNKQERILNISERWQLPLRKQHVYLGAKISYGAFELQNAQHRKQAGQAAFARLRPTLLSQRALSLTKRLRLWQVFVVPATLYSLGASGFTRPAYDLIRVMFVRQIRAIARSPRHLTEESDHSLLHRLGMMSTFHMVRQMQQRILDTTQNLTWTSDGGDFRVHPTILQREIQLLDMVQAIDNDNVPGQVDAHSCQCDQCDKTFDNEAALRAHKAKMHSAERMSAAPTQFDRQLHGTDGMPKCSGCGHAFDRWADLQKHIEENHCQGRIPSAADKIKSVLERMQEGEIDLVQVQNGGLSEELQSELLKHCSLCRQWFPNDRYIRQHWTRVHKSESQLHIAMTKQWRRSQFSPIKGTCNWCRGQVAPRADHRDTCPVLFQLSMVRALMHAGNEADDGVWSTLDLALPAEASLQKWDLKCQICAEAVTAKGLRKHMEQKHATWWQLVRSQVDKLCSAWSTGLHVRICQFCNSKYDKRYRHAISCHAVMQTALARVRTHLQQQEQGEHGADSRAGGGSDAGGVRSSAGNGREEGANDAPGRGGLSARQAQQAQRQGECQQGERTQRMEGQSLQQEDAQPELGQRRRQRGRPSQTLMQSGDTSGGHAQYPEAVYKLGILRQDGGSVGHSGLGDGFAKVVGGDHQAQQPARRDKPADHPAVVSTQSDDRDTQGGHGGSNEEGQGVGLVQRAGAVGLSEVVADQSCAGLEQDVARAPVHTSAVMKLIEDLKALTMAEIVTAFHSKRPLTPNMQGAMVVFHLDVNFRKPEANRFYDLLAQLMGQASLQMGGIQIRKEGYKRSPAVSKLAELIQ